MGLTEELGLILLTFAAGTVIPIQAGLNAGLARRLGHPLHAAQANFVTGAVVVFLVCTVFRIPVPALSAVRTTPPWLWLGGSLGALLVATATLVAPKLGASVMIAVIIASQLITSLILDHYGLMGFRPHPINSGRIAGVVLLLAGMALLRRY